jgi:hypothetical protein
MKIFLGISGIFLLALFGGFVWLAASSAPVQTTEIHKVIPNERFYNAKKQH